MSLAFPCNVFLEILRELNLNSKLRWNESKIGFFESGKIYKMSTPFDLLRFKPLKFFERIKFGIMTLKSSYIQNNQKLKNINAEEWLRKGWGDNIYEKLFRPLLKTKFGMSMNQASAAFVCGRIKARADTRSRGKERLGYLKGGYQDVLEAMKQASNKTTKYHLNSEVKSVEKINNKFVVDFIENGKNEKIEGDFVINTLPIDLSLDLIKGFSPEYKKELMKVRYQAVVCVLLGLKRKLSDYYWINILSEDIPFGVIVEHTNFENKESYNGEHLVYLGKYIGTEEELWQKNDKEIRGLFLDSLVKMFPDFRQEDVLWCKITKEAFATPLFTINFSEIMPGIETPLDGLYIAGSVRVYPNSRNINEVIKSSYKVVDSILKREAIS